MEVAYSAVEKLYPFVVSVPFYVLLRLTLSLVSSIPLFTLNHQLLEAPNPLQK